MSCNCVVCKEYKELIAKKDWALRVLQQRLPMRNDSQTYLHVVIAYGLGEVATKPIMDDYGIENA